MKDVNPGYVRFRLLEQLYIARRSASITAKQLGRALPSPRRPGVARIQDLLRELQASGFPLLGYHPGGHHRNGTPVPMRWCWLDPQILDPQGLRYKQPGAFDWARASKIVRAALVVDDPEPISLVLRAVLSAFRLQINEYAVQLERQRQWVLAAHPEGASRITAGLHPTAHQSPTSRSFDD